MGEEQRAPILAGAATKARQRTLLSWLLALVAGVAVFTLMPRPDPSTSNEPPTAADAAATTASETASAAATPISAPAPDDAPALEKQREDVADAISTLPMVDRAVWSTQSTLQVFLLDGRGDAFDQICPLVIRYDALASSRIQLTPPPGSDLPTRFRQCRSY